MRSRESPGESKNARSPWVTVSELRVNRWRTVKWRKTIGRGGQASPGWPGSLCGFIQWESTQAVALPPASMPEGDEGVHDHEMAVLDPTVPRMGSSMVLEFTQDSRARRECRAPSTQTRAFAQEETAVQVSQKEGGQVSPGQVSPDPVPRRKAVGSTSQRGPIAPGPGEP